MPPRYERAGKPKLPTWWTELVFPLLESGDVDLAEIAALASKFAGRRSPWKRDAISKFKSGSARTRELANGISYALNVPCPYYEARSPAEANAFMGIMRLYDASAQTNPDQQVKLLAADQMAERERRSAIDQTLPVPSDDERSPRRGRSRRASRGRA
jgi:hypothetical protein